MTNTEIHISYDTERTRYACVLGFGAFSVGYGYLVHNVGLIDLKPWVYPLFAYHTFTFWQSPIKQPIIL
ncbi:MAG TPA: hypothetical protein DEF89_22490 [Desulfosporosinus sp.]|nr:hypothetical protein [Desulfosporosinus sp.]